MATTHPNVIPFPVRSGNPTTSDTNEQLLRAARAAYNALLLAVPHGEQNTIVRQLGDAIRAADSSPEPLPPIPAAQRKPIAPVKMSGAVAAQLLHELHSERCVCGGTKEQRRPFCRKCYFALPDALRAAMWLSPVDEANHLLDRMLSARAHLRTIGMISGGVA